MDELERWLTPLGLAALAPSLRANDIDFDILPALTEADLEKLGLSLGHRRKLLAQPAEGLKHISEAAAVMDVTQERDFEAEMQRLRGELLVAAGDRAVAEESYCTALAIARHQSAKLFELRATTSLARLWRDQGRRGEARDLLAPDLRVDHRGVRHASPQGGKGIAGGAGVRAGE